MTASLFVTGTYAASIASHVRQENGDLTARGADVAHAVARPAVDGLDVSVCGLLVTAAAADDWASGRDAPRCEECARIAGRESAVSPRRTA